MLIIDRFEGEYAVCELSNNDSEITRILIERDKLPESAKEGDVIVANGNGYSIDDKQTSQRRNVIIGLSESLFE